MELLESRTLPPQWKAAALSLGVLALAPLFVSGSAGTALRMALGVVAAGLVIAALVATRKRWPSRVSEAPVQVVTRSALGPRTSIAVVEFEGRRLLVGFGDGFAQVLSTSRVRRKSQARVEP